MDLNVNSQASRGVEQLELIAADTARFLFDQKADQILVLRVREMIHISSYFILASGRSARQVRTMGDSVERFLKPMHLPRIGFHGRDDSRWYCLDHGEIVIHLFEEEAREYYDLENLWVKAPRLEVDFMSRAITSEPEDAA
ncbi:MAG TPA: ribosome silencing factor [Planctomycetes bacterium]|nr:ribosome silencing factor [Planctomycetota bacterium]HIK82515.1 ribosome silencing factor [Planctomycetota bacterium]